jgi:prepilin-type N-terminal cleavage/methylation domain-containing protein
VRQVCGSSKRGFTLLEMMISLALGLLVVASAVKLYSQGVDATWVISQRAEMQQDLRAAEDLLFRDISLAGSGLTSLTGESVPLPTAVSGLPIYGCSAGPVCPPNGGVAYPCVGAGCTTPALYPIMPGFGLGIKPPGSPTASDIITVVYSDNTLALNCYSGSAAAAGGPTAANNAISFSPTGNVLTFTAPVSPPPAGCVLPPGLAYPQALNNCVNGLQPGDVILVGPNSSSNAAVGEVTTVTPAPSCAAAAPGDEYVVAFANGDTLNMNQAGAVNDLTALNPKAGTGGQVANLVANRIFVITYYLKNIPDPTGVTTGTTILYRQVNGQPAVPLADNIAALQFTYDTYDASGDLLNATGDGGEALGISPNQIRKINILHLTIHSQLSGTRSSLMATSGYQSFDVQTSISARNLSYNNRY